MNKILIVANWKMNPSNSKEAWDLADAVKQGVAEIQDAKVVLCPPFVFVPQILPVGNVELGAQDCFWEESGAFTGEISPSMLKNLGCSYVILGHSERRQLGETFEMINRKLKAALAAGLTPVVCIGEEIEKEMGAIFQDIGNLPYGESNSRQWKLKIENLVLVYEPEWAISTVKNAKADSPEHVKKAIKRIKAIAGSDIPVLYGGSTNSENVKGFLESGSQGALVGSSSIHADEFIQLVKNAAMR